MPVAIRLSPFATVSFFFPIPLLHFAGSSIAIGQAFPVDIYTLILCILGEDC